MPCCCCVLSAMKTVATTVALSIASTIPAKRNHAPCFSLYPRPGHYISFAVTGGMMLLTVAFVAYQAKRRTKMTKIKKWGPTIITACAGNIESLP